MFIVSDIMYRTTAMTTTMATVAVMMITMSDDNSHTSANIIIWHSYKMVGSSVSKNWIIRARTLFIQHTGEMEKKNKKNMHKKLQLHNNVTMHKQENQLTTVVVNKVTTTATNKNMWKIVETSKQGIAKKTRHFRVHILFWIFTRNIIKFDWIICRFSDVSSVFAHARQRKEAQAMEPQNETGWKFSTKKREKAAEETKSMHTC